MEGARGGGNNASAFLTRSVHKKVPPQSILNSATSISPYNSFPFLKGIFKTSSLVLKTQILL